MPWVEKKHIPSVLPETIVKPGEPNEERERRHAARRFFHNAPPYCIEFNVDGTALLCQKFYEYWPDHEPEEATTWRVISRHQDLEEAERRLRLICTVPVYYDARGQVVDKSPRRKPRWDMPPTDEE